MGYGMRRWRGYLFTFGSHVLSQKHQIRKVLRRVPFLENLKDKEIGIWLFTFHFGNFFSKKRAPSRVYFLNINRAPLLVGKGSIARGVDYLSAVYIRVFYPRDGAIREIWQCQCLIKLFGFLSDNSIVFRLQNFFMKVLITNWLIVYRMFTGFMFSNLISCGYSFI